MPDEVAERSADLEREAIALFKQYGFFLPMPVKLFFRNLAKHNGWTNLLKVI